MLGSFALATGVGAQVAVGDAVLVSRLEKLARRAEALGVRTGIEVHNAGTGQLLFARRRREAFAPASNMKLYTAAFALEELGADYRFRTRCYVHTVGGEHLLRIVASGDPCLAAKVRQGRRYFEGLANALVAADLHSLGGVVLEATAWTGPDRPSGWPRDQLHRPYAARTGPFVVEEASFSVVLVPAARGNVARARILPEGVSVGVHGQVALTLSRRKGSRPRVSLGRDGVHLGGRLYRGYPQSTYAFASPTPRADFLGVLRFRLAEKGIRLGNELARLPSDAGAGRCIYTIESPLTWSLRRLLRDSSNFHAEQLLRVVAQHRGKPATLEAGRALLAASFAPSAVDAASFVVADGSGLSRANRTSPKLLCDLIDGVLASKRLKPFVGALPQSGISGTIRTRMTRIRGRVRAKTGWIAGASALSGTVRSARGHVLLFSILMNYDRHRGGINAGLKAIQDRIVEALYDHG